MNSSLRPGRIAAIRLIAIALACLGLTACEYEVALTATPTRSLEPKLLGNWVSVDGKEHMKVREYDASNYAIAYNGDLYRAHHSDFAGRPFVSVLHLDETNRKYSLVTWALTENGQRLQLKVVSSKVVATDARDPAALQKSLQAGLGNPVLFGFEQSYVREK